VAGVSQAAFAVRVHRASFRRRYASHSLRDAGESTFAGRRARAYEVTDPGAPTPGVRRPPVDSETYYLDAESGNPLGRALGGPMIACLVVSGGADRDVFRLQ